MVEYLSIAAVSGLVAFLLTPAVKRVAVARGYIDSPTDRAVHLSPTPTIGGVALVAGIAAGFAVAAVVPALRDSFRFTEAAGLVAGAILTLVLGLLDDRHELSPRAKFAGQVFAAGIVYLAGVRLTYFWTPGLGVLYLSPDISAIATVLWIVLLMNATNFIDGLDGLCAGLTAIASAALLVYTLDLPSQFLGPDPVAPLVSAAVFGACLGFLPHNFNPAKIFMGDTGAMPLGLLLGGATVSVIGRYAGGPSSVGRVALPLIFMPLVLIAVPLADLLLAVFRRWRAGKPVTVADKEHIHHRLMNIGHSHRRAVLIMYGWAALLAGGLVLAGRVPWGAYTLAAVVLTATVAVVTILPRLTR